MTKKYEFTGEEKDGLKRIRALRAFGSVRAGDLGGWIESEKNLSHDGDCWVYRNAQVYENARVFGTAQVFGNARVFGDARAYGDAWIYEYAQVYEYARVFSNARVFGNARVFSNARVGGEARVFDDARVGDNAWIYEYAHVSGSNHLKGSTVVTKPSLRTTEVNGYEFSLLRDADGKKVVNAGCRYFKLKKAKKFWEKTRGGTPLGDETMKIIEFLENVS